MQIDLGVLRDGYFDMNVTVPERERRTGRDPHIEADGVSIFTFVNVNVPRADLVTLGHDSRLDGWTATPHFDAGIVRINP